MLVISARELGMMSVLNGDWWTARRDREGLSVEFCDGQLLAGPRSVTDIKAGGANRAWTVGA